MRHPALPILLLPLLVAGAEDPWMKVREIKTGSEVRIFRKAAAQPVVAVFDEATAENLIIVIKDRQTAIPKDSIERLDARAASMTRHVVRENKSTTRMSDGREGAAGRPGSHAGVTTNHSTGLLIGGKPDFETVYRRLGAPPRK